MTINADDNFNIIEATPSYGRPMARLIAERGTFGKLAPAPVLYESTPNRQVEFYATLSENMREMPNDRRFYSLDMECGVELKAQFEMAAARFKAAGINAAILQGRLHELHGRRPMREPRRTVMSHYINVALNHWENT